MQLEEFFDYKNQLMKDILVNSAITNLVNPNISNPNLLAYTQVFPYEYIPDTIDEGKTFICFDVDVSKTYDKTFLSPSIYIWIFTHKSQLRLPEGGVRIDKLSSEICNAINGSRKYGLGELNLKSATRFIPTIDFQGRVLLFEAKDINRLYDPAKYTPSNRKDCITD